MVKRIFFILFALTLFCSCQKANKNGDLDGFWKLLQIEDFSTGTITETRNVDRFWSVQLDLLVVSGGGKGRFQHVGDSLFVQMIHVPTMPKEMGLYNPLDEHFFVEHLSRKRMILRSRDVELTFTKF